MRELLDLRAIVSISGAGRSSAFPYNRGRRQGGQETPDEFNMVSDYIDACLQNGNTTQAWEKISATLEKHSLLLPMLQETT